MSRSSNNCLPAGQLSIVDVELALSVAEKFRVKNKDAKQLLVEVQKSVANWKKVAEQFGINRTGVSQMAPAFSLEGKS
jgi:hypothetical protein